MQSCNDCPSLVPASETQARLGRFTGTDLCMTHGHVLGRPGQTDPHANDRIKIAFGTACGDWGNPAPQQKPIIGGEVAIGDPAIASRMSAVYPNGVPDNQQPTTCAACEHFVPSETVKNELGWILPMCAAKGRLLFPQNLVREAANCGTSLHGSHRTSTDGIILLPTYETPVTVASRSGAMMGASSHDQSAIARHRVDPRLYETDREVTQEDIELNIRAWRRVDDPEGLHDPVFIPIFDGRKLVGFDPRSTYGSHRPDLYIDHQGILYDAAVEFFELDETPVLIGSAGTGKTEFFCWIAWLCDLPFTRISIDKGTEPYHLFGESKLEIDHETQQPVTNFKLGRYAKAYTEPGVVCVDEPNVQASIFETLRPSFDNARQLVIDADQGFTCSRGWPTFVGCAQNPAHDPLYVGTEPMSAADIDRVTPIYFDLPQPEVERDIIKVHCADTGYQITEGTLDKIMTVAESIRLMIADGTLPIAWGLRSQIKVARKTQYYSLEKAYRRAVLDGMEAEVMDAVMGIVRSVA